MTTVVSCASEEDAVRAVARAAASGLRLVPRGGGHCFAGRSSAGDIVLDMSPMDTVEVAGDSATIGAGALLGGVYAGLHAHGRTLPAGCGATVGIAGLTLGGGIGLLGRRHGLTCDRLTGARVVLADGSIVDCSATAEPDLFWALRGAGGGQFGVVTSLRFGTVPEPRAVRIEGRLAATAGLVADWQEWAPDAPGGLTVNLALTAGRATLFGASTLGEVETRRLLAGFGEVAVHVPEPFHRLKRVLSEGDDGAPVRIRSEFFDRPLSTATVEALLAGLGPGRRLAFTAMGGAYDRVPAEATAFAHRGRRFLLEHIAAPGDPWLDASWAIAHREGTGRVYPNFPDPALDDPATAYHAGNHARLTAIKKTYDPHRFFDFPQAI